jgi:3-deoxy-D-manno-octulosonic-acid transferase
MRLARSAYSLLLRLATPAYLARLWWRGRASRCTAATWPSGWGVDARCAGAHGRLWLHAVSLGETRAAAA